MQNLAGKKSWVRPGVVTGPTTVGEDPTGLGAFAPDWETTPRAAFIGVYRAPQWRRASGMTEYRGTSDYVMQVGAWRAGPRVVRQKTYPNLADFKMMALQEPPAGKEANCQFMYFSRADEINAPIAKSRAVSLVAVYTTREIEPGEELFVYYGAAKARDYDVGSPGPELFKYEIPRQEYPHAWRGGMEAAADGWREK